MPDEKDLRRIGRMIRDTGEKELELGEITEADLDRLYADEGGDDEVEPSDLPGPDASESPGSSGPEEAGPEEAGQGEAGSEGDDLESLLQEIELGLQEERTGQEQGQSGSQAQEDEAAGEPEPGGGQAGGEPAGDTSEPAGGQLPDELAGIPAGEDDFPDPFSDEFPSSEPHETGESPAPVPAEDESESVPAPTGEGPDTDQAAPGEEGFDLDLPEDFDLASLAEESPPDEMFQQSTASGPGQPREPEPGGDQAAPDETPAVEDIPDFADTGGDQPGEAPGPEPGSEELPGTDELPDSEEPDFAEELAALETAFPEETAGPQQSTDGPAGPGETEDTGPAGPGAASGEDLPGSEINFDWEQEVASLLDDADWDTGEGESGSDSLDLSSLEELEDFAETPDSSDAPEVGAAPGEAEEPPAASSGDAPGEGEISAAGEGEMGVPDESGETAPGESGPPGAGPQPEEDFADSDFEDIELPDLDLESDELEPASSEQMAEIAAEADAETAHPGMDEPSGGPEGPEQEEDQEPEMDVTDEDIVLITAKLKQIDPSLASSIRDIILNRSLPAARMNDLLALLIQDASQEDLSNYLGQAGVHVPRAGAGARVVRVPTRPGSVERMVQNLGPLVRVAGLGALVLIVLGAIFMIFLHPLVRARNHYRQGLEYIQIEQYGLAEEQFQQGRDLLGWNTGFHVEWYDRYGWEYMLAGNYGAAERKLEEGILLEFQGAFDLSREQLQEQLKELPAGEFTRDLEIDNLDIRLHLARLHNILGNYEKADQIYRQVVSSDSGYEHVKLRGLNLFDWGKDLAPEKLDEAYGVFERAYSEKPRNSDPLFQMLKIEIFKDNPERVRDIHQYLKARFPRDVDVEAYTELASYYISRENFSSVRELLYGVLEKEPEYPSASYAFARYYGAVGNNDLQEEFLNQAIRNEQQRPLQYPWQQRDRNLLSRAYNDLGLIYASSEIPGMAADAIRYYRKAIEQDESNHEAHFNLAQVYFYEENNYDQARRYYETAEDLSSGWRSADLNYNLGMIHFYQRDFRRAVERWSRLTNVVPGNPNVLTALGSALLYMDQWEAALGELLVVSEVYDTLIQDLGTIKPWSAYHRRILSETASVYNNIGVAYQMLYRTTGKTDYERESLVALYRAGELADTAGVDRGVIQYNINYIVHPEIIRGSMAIDDSLSENYRFVYQ